MSYERITRRESNTKPANSSTVRRVADTPRVQLKLRVGSVDDPLEREADRVAAEVLMRLADNAALPSAASPAEGSARVQRSATAESLSRAPGHGRDGGDAEQDVARRVQRSSGGGRPLDGDVRGRMEQGFGADFSGVRVHADSDAADLSRSLNARAFTTGSDIYFGKGQYQPDSSSGQELLAHELTHTLQQSSSRVQRSALPAATVSDDRSDRVRRWDLKSGVDVSKATTIRTIESGQAVFILKDNSGDEIVIKAENYPMGLMKLATLVHESVHEVDIIDSHEVDTSQKAVLTQKIGDPAVAKDPSWAAVGKTSKLKSPGDDDATAGRKHHQQQIGGLALAAQAFAKGKDAKQLSQSKDKHENLRAMLQSPKWMNQIGAAAAADMFTGNADRAGGVVNLGNFITTANERVQLIDNMDANAKNTFDVGADDLFPYDMQDWGKGPDAFYAMAVRMLLQAAEKTDPGITAWADADGGFTRKFMEQDYKKGFEDTVAKIVKLYGTAKGKSSGRAVKAEVKALDSSGYLDFWEVLKARARYMQNPAKGQALRAQVLKRQTAIDKKAAKKR